MQSTLNEYLNVLKIELFSIMIQKIKKVLVCVYMSARFWKGYIYMFLHGLSRYNIKCIGTPQIVFPKNSRVSIRGEVLIVSDSKFATLGHPMRSKLLVYPNASLSINGNVSMSNTLIVATQSVQIGNNVMVGGGKNS